MRMCRLAIALKVDSLVTLCYAISKVMVHGMRVVSHFTKRIFTDSECFVLSLI